VDCFQKIIEEEPRAGQQGTPIFFSNTREYASFKCKYVSRSSTEKDFFIDNLLVRILYIVVMIT